MELQTVHFDIGYNIILGQSHFIKTVEDVYEAIINVNANALFGIAFCEASQDMKIRFDGTDTEMQKLAVDMAKKVMCGHFFVIVLKDIYPVNVLNALKTVPEIVTLFCATQNPIDVVIADVDGRRGVLGVIDGQSKDLIETDDDVKARHDFLRKINYKK